MLWYILHKLKNITIESAEYGMRIRFLNILLCKCNFDTANCCRYGHSMCSGPVRHLPNKLRWTHILFQPGTAQLGRRVREVDSRIAKEIILNLFPERMEKCNFWWFKMKYISQMDIKLLHCKLMMIFDLVTFISAMISRFALVSKKFHLYLHIHVCK